MTDSRYFLGLDGGGTKTHCVLYDAVNDRLNFISGGPTNHEVLPGGMEDLSGAIGSLVSPLLAEAGIGIADIGGAAFGMGGIDMPLQYEIIHSIVAETGFKNFGLCNDGYLGIRAEFNGKGISAVNGSGYSVVGIGPGGKTFQIGGHSDMSGDVGGGTYLVPAVVRSVYTALFKKGPQTRLTDLMFEWLGISDRLDFVQAAAVQILGDKAGAYHKISRILYKAADMGDETALKILEDCGNDYALSISCVAEALAFESPIDVVLIGSQFAKCENDHAIRTMERSLNPPDRPPGFRLKVISTAPVAGALFWAMELAGAGPGEAKRAEFRERLSHLERNGYE